MIVLYQSGGTAQLHFNVLTSDGTPYSTLTTDVKSSSDVVYTVGKTVLASSDAPYAVS